MAYSEISLDDAWELLAADSDAALVDVRTEAEWNFVGMPDLATLGKRVQLAEWTRYPDGSPNDEFVGQATDGLSAEHPILLICRSGARSRAAAQRLEAAGFEHVYNVTDGFEGNLDGNGHRHGGWKDALPWQQS
ncbi:MAG: rhodanese-like domain-containing protein [Acidimicrobiales bacterium]